MFERGGEDFYSRATPYKSLMFSNPEKVVEQASLNRGMRVADLGAGSGFYSRAAARAVGSEGRVYAIDIQKDLLGKVKAEAQKENLFNVEIIWGDIEKLGGTHLKDSSLDYVLLSNILFQTRDKDTVISETTRILKPGGGVLVVDWSDSFGGFGPRPEEIISGDTVKNLLEQKGFSLEKEIQAGDHHYGLIMRKSLIFKG